MQFLAPKLNFEQMKYPVFKTVIVRTVKNFTDIQNFTFLRLIETKCANSYVNWGAEQENNNKNASLNTVFELSSLTCTIS
jgi:hypothetical protein